MEALLLVVDVGPSAGAPAADGGSSFLETASRCCDRIAQRKLFADKNKDHVAVVLVGSEETDNPLAEDDQYEHVSVTRRLAPVDWELVRLLREELRATTAEGDWLDGLVVALDHLREMARTHKYTSRRLVLMTDFAGPLCGDQLAAISAGLAQLDVDLTVIGVEPAEDGPEPDGGGDEPRPGPSRPHGHLRHDGKPKTQRQLDGEAAAAELVRAVDGRFFSFEQALPQLLFFHKRTARAAPWNAPLEIGADLSIPVTGYSQIKKATTPSWRKMTVGANPQRVVRRTTYQRQDEARTAVPPEETVRAYQYGTTQVPFSHEDEDAQRYRSGAPRSLQVLGFTAAANVGAHQFQDTQTVQVVARRGDPAAEAALSALIHALHETDMCAVARRTYNNGNQPRLGALLPLIRPAFECLLWVQLPFAEDARNPRFEPLPAPADAAMAAVDRLIDTMDLTAPAAQPAAERLAPGALVSPQFQRLYQVLAARALRPAAPLPPPDADLVRLLAPEPALEASAGDALRALAVACPLQELTQPHQRRETGRDVFGAAPAAATDAVDAAPPAADVTEVGTVSPAEDFVAMLHRDDVQFDQLCSQIQRVIGRLVRDCLSQPALLEKTLEAVVCLRTHCARIDPAGYNAWVRGEREHLRLRPAVWEQVRQRRLGPIAAAETSLPTAADAEVEEFYRDDERAAPAAPPGQDDPDDLLDDL